MRPRDNVLPHQEAKVGIDDLETNSSQETRAGSFGPMYWDIRELRACCGRTRRTTHVRAMWPPASPSFFIDLTGDDDDGKSKGKMDD